MLLTSSKDVGIPAVAKRGRLAILKAGTLSSEADMFHDFQSVHTQNISIKLHHPAILTPVCYCHEWHVHVSVVHLDPFKRTALPELKAALANGEYCFHTSQKLPFSNRLYFLFQILSFSQRYLGLPVLKNILKDSGIILCRRQRKGKALAVPFKQTITQDVLLRKQKALLLA